MTCGVGTRTRTRNKQVTEENSGNCSGNSTETVRCEEKECNGKFYMAIFSNLILNSLNI